MTPCRITSVLQPTIGKSRVAKFTKHTESQIAEILREARQTSINAVAARYNVSEAAIYAWHAKFGHLGAEEIKRLRHLKLQHARRQRFVP